MDFSESLHPRVINDLLFGDLASGQSGGGDKRDVAVNRVVGEAFRGEVANHRSVFSELTQSKPYHTDFARFLAGRQHADSAAPRIAIVQRRRAVASERVSSNRDGFR